jgi:hypothetical protein
MAVALAATGGAADLGTLLDQVRAAAARKDHAKVVAALEDALVEARREAPLTAAPFLLVTAKAPMYGAYVPRPGDTFADDEPMHFYLEPKNLVYPKTADGTYAPGLTVDVELLARGGDVVWRKDRFGDFSFVSRSRLQDIYVNLTLTVTGAEPGRYTVRYTVRDKNSPKTAILTQAVTRR